MSLRISQFVPVVVCAALLAACGDGGGAAAIRPASGVAPASTGSDPVPLGGAVRRTQSAGTCSSPGTGSFNGVPANANVSGGTDSVVGGGSGNKGCDDHSAITGGNGNVIAGTSGGASDSFIGGGYQNQIYATAAYSVIAGGYQNVVDPTNGNSSTVVGGAFNTASSAGASVLGGETNTASGFISMLGGGQNNTVSGDYGFGGGGSHNTVSNMYAAIAGGEYNQAIGEGAYIGGGGYNIASGEGAIVDGGFNSTAAGTFATVPGGYKDSAAGTYSFAAGSYATAAQTGTFVWSDGSNGNTPLTSTQAYAFLARASGGFTLYTNTAATVGAQLAAGSGTWASLSDRNVKTNIAPLDDAVVLDKVAALPISRWSYKTEHGVRHVGPMAQDFYAAFKVGEDDKHITSIDEDGVALAAIKALHAENADAHAAMTALHARVGVLDAQNVSLRAQLAALKASQARRDLLVDRRLERLTVALSASRER
jgi:hypothetical protein